MITFLWAHPALKLAEGTSSCWRFGDLHGHGWANLATRLGPPVLKPHLRFVGETNKRQHSCNHIEKHWHTLILNIWAGIYKLSDTLPEFWTRVARSELPVSPVGRCQDIWCLSKPSPAPQFAAGWSWSSSSCGSVLRRIYPLSVQCLQSWSSL